MGDLPVCFGDTDLYDPKDPECCGGYDPNFKGEDGSHISAKCAVFEGCGAHCRAKNGLTKIGTKKPEASPGRSVTVLQDGGSKKVAERVVLAPQQQQFVTSAQLQAQPAPVMVANQLMPVNYGMPAYLSVLEPERKKKGKKWKSLTSEVGRSIGKSVGHSVAHFFDSVPWLSDDDD